jgi:ABC-type transport system substrate-binding protein
LGRFAFEKKKGITAEAAEIRRGHGDFGVNHRLHGRIALACVASIVGLLCACGHAKRAPGDVVFVIESNPANLDPRYATDGTTQRIDRLIFSGLVTRDAQMNLHGDLAESWETPDPLTYVFHLKKDVKFHDGRPVTSRDVKATIEYMMDPANKSPKRGSFNMIASIEAPDAETVIFHLKEPYASFLWNMEKSAVGIVPAGAGMDFSKKPVGSGPFQFVSQAQDDAVVLERYKGYKVASDEWRVASEKTEIRHRDTENSEKTLPPSGSSNQRSLDEKAPQGLKPNLAGAGMSDLKVRPPKEGEEGKALAAGGSQSSAAIDENSPDSAGNGNPKIPGAEPAPGAPGPRTERVTFRVVPDAIVRALELRKGSADVEMSSLSPDMVPVLAKHPELEVTEEAGTNFAYLGVNLEDPILAKKEVRQALAYAIDRETLVKYLLHGQARLASGILPPNHWAYEGDVKKYGYDLAEANRLLETAGFPRGADGVRMRLTLKVSTQEQARLIGAALQDQWKKVGVALEVRPLELATLLADLDKGNFQLSYSIWVGANNDPDIFDLVFSSKKIPPNGRNRGRYRNARVDESITQIRGEMDQAKRKELCSEIQKILAEELPYVPMWYVDQVSVHRKELDVELTPTGDFDFLGR